MRPCAWIWGVSFLSTLTVLSFADGPPDSECHDHGSWGQDTDPKLPDELPKAMKARPTGERIRYALKNRLIPIASRYETENDMKRALLANGYIPSHGWTQYRGMGVAWASAVKALITPNAKLREEAPIVLYFRSLSPKLKGLSAAQRDAMLSDQIPDPPYELVSAGWIRNYNGNKTNETFPVPEKTPSDLAGIFPNGQFPNGMWFRHTAGCHMSTGEFAPFRENYPAPGTTLRFFHGAAVCKRVGMDSVWKPAGEIAPGAPGFCMLDRAMRKDDNGLFLRPVVKGARLNMSAPAKFRAKPSSAKEIALWEKELVTATTKECQNVERKVEGNMATFWHGTAWDSHLYFNHDGTTHFAVYDMGLVPDGYGSAADYVVAFPPGTAEKIPVK